MIFSETGSGILNLSLLIIFGRTSGGKSVAMVPIIQEGILKKEE
jgi:archaellum biogenesis ATPase FlaH